MVRQASQKGPRRQKQQRGNKRQNHALGAVAKSTEFVPDARVVRKQRDDSPLVPKTESQKLYMESIRANTLTFGIGPAGTGKTHVAVSVACEMFIAGEIDRIVATRPALGSEEELGFFPGDLNEKFAPWMVPIRDVLDKRIGRSHVDYLIKHDVISFQPFATMRGLSWANAFIILDEAQNTTPKQMELFLTRVGENSRVVVDGDVRQKDIRTLSGLEDSIVRLHHRSGVGLVEFSTDDIVRSGFVRMVIESYRD